MGKPWVDYDSDAPSGARPVFAYKSLRNRERLTTAMEQFSALFAIEP